MMGVLREIFDERVDEICNLYLKQVGTPFEVPSPIIVDIDQGQVIQIENYKARRDLRILQERNL